METVDEIWAGDLFDRKKEAFDLIGYLESVAGRVPIREDGHAHVMAIDTAYGHGKTFFLKRLDRQLKATEHVSAYVDAWVDDLEDQPMVALAATLDRALKPWAEKSGDVATGLTQFKSTAGRVAKIVGMGLAKRGAGFLITQGAAEALSDELSKVSEAARDNANDALKDHGKGVVDDFIDAFEPTTTPTMEARIARFREGQEAIHAMKASLTFVVEALVKAGMRLPITIIVDELDRCRPTYSIKVLEEIKHLFDVPGVAFLLGLHGRQLERSVTFAYGSKFDGAAYLRRFFNRRYKLRAVELTPLVSHLIQLLGINENRMDHPSVQSVQGGKPVQLGGAQLISAYLRMYDLTARDAFSILEALQTAMALSPNRGLQMSYLLPLIISHYLGSEELIQPTIGPVWSMMFTKDPFGREFEEVSVNMAISSIHHAAMLNDLQLAEGVNSNDKFCRIVTEYGFKNSSSDYHLLQNYRELVHVVSRFS